MKVLKNGFKLKDFKVTFMINNKTNDILIKDKGSKSQAIHQVEKSLGKEAFVLSVKAIV